MSGVLCRSPVTHHPKGQVMSLGLVGLDNTVVAILLPGPVLHGQSGVGISVMLKLRICFLFSLGVAMVILF